MMNRFRQSLPCFSRSASRSGSHREPCSRRKRQCHRIGIFHARRRDMHSARRSDFCRVTHVNSAQRPPPLLNHRLFISPIRVQRHARTMKRGPRFRWTKRRGHCCPVRFHSRGEFHFRETDCRTLSVVTARRLSVGRCRNAYISV